jgi:hypothetical protein
MSRFLPKHIEIFYDTADNPIAVRMSGETIENTGILTNTSIDYPLSGGDRTAFASLLSTIKSNKGR